MVHQNVTGPAIFPASINIPVPFFGVSDLIQQDHVMSPWNLCNNLLHKFRIRVRCCKFRHVFQISYGIARRLWEFQIDILRQIFNKFITPAFVRVDYTSDAVIQHDEFCIDMNSRLILGCFDFLLHLFNGSKVFI